MYTEPPSPPSPPLGPPFSMNFSRRKLIIPLPPSPAFTCIDTSSTNFIACLPPQRASLGFSWNPEYRNKKAPSQDRALPAASRSGRDDAHVAAIEGALHFELDHAIDLGEQGVVLAHADAVTGVELGAALTHDDVAGLDGLAAIHLHAKAFAF